MRSIRITLSFLTAMMLAAFTLPSFAATKTFAFGVTSSGTTANVTFTDSASGGSGSSINSLRFSFPTTSSISLSNLSYTGFSLTSSSNNPPVIVDCATTPGTCTVTVQYMTSINPGKSGTITVTGVTYPTDVSACSNGYQWSGQAYTGNALGGTAFLVAGTTSTTATSTVNASCSLTFTTQPSSQQSGTNVSGTVQLSVNGSPGAGATVYLYSGAHSSSMCSSAPITGYLDSATTDSNGNATFSESLSLGSPYVLTACITPTLYAQSNAFGVYAGTLACNGPFGDASVSGLRSGWNKDTTCPSAILYTFTDNLSQSTPSVEVNWDLQSAQHPSLMYQIAWNPEDVANGMSGSPSFTNDSTAWGWPVTKRVYVQWRNPDGTLTTAQPALACARTGTDQQTSDPNAVGLPAPYGTLTTALSTSTPGTQDTVQLSTSALATLVTANIPTASLPTLPAFPITIDTERMLVIGVSLSTTDPSSYVLTVLRGQGGTTASDHAATTSASTTFVMSTPLPLDASGKQVPVCVFSHGWQAAGVDAYDSSTMLPLGSNPASSTTVLVPQVQFVTTVYDLGDALISYR